MSDYHTTALRKAFRELLRSFQKSPTDAGGAALISILEQLGQKSGGRKLEAALEALEERISRLESRARLSDVSTYTT